MLVPRRDRLVRALRGECRSARYVLASTAVDRRVDPSAGSELEAPDASSLLRARRSPAASSRGCGSTGCCGASPSASVWAAFMFVNGFVTIGLLAAVAMVAAHAVRLSRRSAPPRSSSSSRRTLPTAIPRHTLIGHAIGIVCGYGALVLVRASSTRRRRWWSASTCRACWRRGALARGDRRADDPAQGRAPAGRRDDADHLARDRDAAAAPRRHRGARSRS